MRIMTVALLLMMSAIADADCIVEMNGKWDYIPGKSLDEGGPDWETLDFTNTEAQQSYTMEYGMDDGETGSFVWSVPCDGEEHPTPPAPWDDSPGRTVTIERLGEKTELVTFRTDGEVTNSYTRVLIDNDNTLVSIGRLADGQIEWVRVFERQ